ncbi:MAG: EAL domain-containing protein [Desulfovibrionaceae bacterium]
MPLSCSDLTDLDIHEIIEKESIVTRFQPLISLKRGSIFGFEALSRGLVPGSGVTIPPQALFSLAEDMETRLALDRVCRKKALESFAPLHERNRALMVSINIDASVINDVSVGSQVLLKQLKASGVSANNVIVEIIESRATSIEALMTFVAYYQKHGFLIALDDVGAGHSNLDRIPMLQPDILKIDRSLVTGVHEHFHKLEVVKSFVKMGGRLGSLVLAEGVETREEILALMECGLDVFQGFYFGRPGTGDDDRSGTSARIHEISTQFKTHTMERINAEKRMFSMYDSLIRSICAELTASCGNNMDARLTAFIDLHPNIECLYVLDMEGRQVSGTICNPDRLQKSKRLIYEPACIGADHSLKEYYLPIRAGLSKYTTEPYISLASGNRCITISCVYTDPSGDRRILCTDIAHLF